MDKVTKFCSDHKTPILVTAGAVTMAVAAPLVVPTVVTTLGFTSAGIAAGSTGASIMASYGGVVTSGSLCAGLQSVGVVGLSPIVTGATAVIGGAVGGVGGGIISKLTGKKTEEVEQWAIEFSKKTEEEKEKVTKAVHLWVKEFVKPKL